MQKAKDEFYVFSIFSTELLDYPYYPFIAKSLDEGLNKYKKFISNRDTICAGAELHVIGSCKVDIDGIIPETIQPFISPMRVIIRDNIWSKTCVVASYYIDQLMSYIDRYLRIKRKEKQKWMKKKK